MVIYDSLSYFVEYSENNTFIEGYDGFKIIEIKKDNKCYVIYKEFRGNAETEKRFYLPTESIDEFLRLYKTCRDYFEKQKFLFSMLVEAEKRLTYRTEEELKNVCDDIYYVPKNYLRFVALAMNNSEFFNLAKEKILNKSNILN